MLAHFQASTAFGEPELGGDCRIDEGFEDLGYGLTNQQLSFGNSYIFNHILFPINKDDLRLLVRKCQTITSTWTQKPRSSWEVFFETLQPFQLLIIIRMKDLLVLSRILTFACRFLPLVESGSNACI